MHPNNLSCLQILQSRFVHINVVKSKKWNSIRTEVIDKLVQFRIVYTRSWFRVLFLDYLDESMDYEVEKNAAKNTDDCAWCTRISDGLHINGHRTMILVIHKMQFVYFPWCSLSFDEGKKNGQLKIRKQEEMGFSTKLHRPRLDLRYISVFQFEIARFCCEHHSSHCCHRETGRTKHRWYFIVANGKWKWKRS